MSKNPFSKKINYQQEVKEIRTKEFQKVIAIASKCLANEDFAKYAKEVEELKIKILNAIINCPETNPVEYAFIVKDLISKYESVTLLLDRINLDAKLAQENEEKGVKSDEK